MNCIKFKDHPEFTPNLSPKEIIQLGSFGGGYFRPIYSTITKKKYINQHLEFPKNWFENIDIEKYVTSEVYDYKINKYKVECGMSLEYWESKKWIHEQDPYGWFQWYCRFYCGRRSDDDTRQIKRWKNFIKRWTGVLISKCEKNNRPYNDITVSPRIRQSLQHWAYSI